MVYLKTMHDARCTPGQVGVGFNAQMKYVMFLSLLLATAAVLAISISPPKPYVLESEDGRLLFVSISPDYSDQAEESEEEQRVRHLYKKSGVYKNDGSREMLWSLDGYIYDSTAVIYFNHESLVVAGDPHDNDVALVFYKNGKEIKSYKVAELTDDSRYLSRLNGSYDAAVYAMSESWLKSTTTRGRLLIIENREGDTLTFEIKTGERLFDE